MPTRFNRQQVENSLRRTKGRVFLAARDLGVAPKTIYRYLERWPKLRELVEDQKGEMLDTAELKLHEAILRGEPWAICFFLKCQGWKRGWLERNQTRVSGNIDADVKLQVVQDDDWYGNADRFAALAAAEPASDPHRNGEAAEGNST